MFEHKVSVFIKKSNDPLFNEIADGWWQRQDADNIEFIWCDKPDLKKASGEYVLFCSDSDVYEERALSKLLDIAEANKSDIIFFNMEAHWESNSDVRAFDSVNYAFPFYPYSVDGQPVLNSTFFNGVNTYLGACLFRRDFLIKKHLSNIENEKTLVRQCLMNSPKVFTTKDYLGHHVVRLSDGNRTAFDYLSGELDSYNHLRAYANSSFVFHRWRPIIDQMVNILSMDSVFGSMSKVVPLDFIPQCSIHLVDHCNLNCKSCSHFSCLARKGDFELKPEDFKRDIKQLAKVTKRKVNILELYGGEPLLHPNVCVFMKLARRYFPRSTIRFITNGILLPSQPEKFWKSVHKYKILIAPTKYPINVDWDKVHKLADKYKCHLEFFGGTGYCQKTLYHKPLDVHGHQNGAISYINCQHTRCINLYKGRLYHCPVVAYIKYFNREFNKNLKQCESDSLDIYEKNLKPADVFSYCSRPIPFCRYCMTRNTTHGHPWERTKKDIAEWTLK